MLWIPPFPFSPTSTSGPHLHFKPHPSIILSSPSSSLLIFCSSVSSYCSSSFSSSYYYYYSCYSYFLRITHSCFTQFITCWCITITYYNIHQPFVFNYILFLYYYVNKHLLHLAAMRSIMTRSHAQYLYADNDQTLESWSRSSRGHDRIVVTSRHGQHHKRPLITFAM